MKAMTGFDSMAAMLLFTACAGGWVLAGRQRAGARLYARLAAMLLSALAVCALLTQIGGSWTLLAMAAGLFLLPLVAAAWVIAMLARFARPLPVVVASLLLVTGLGLGLAATLTGQAVLVVAPLMLAGLASAAAGLDRMAPLAVLGALALTLAGLAFPLQGAGAGVLLLLGAAILGLTRVSAQPVQMDAGLRHGNTRK